MCACRLRKIPFMEAVGPIITAVIGDNFSDDTLPNKAMTMVKDICRKKRRYYLSKRKKKEKKPQAEQANLEKTNTGDVCDDADVHVYVDDVHAYDADVHVYVADVYVSVADMHACVADVHVYVDNTN